MPAQNARFSTRIFLRLTAIGLAAWIVFGLGGLAYFDQTCRTRARAAASAAERALALDDAHPEAAGLPGAATRDLQALLAPGAAASGGIRTWGARWLRYAERTWWFGSASAWTQEWRAAHTASRTSPAAGPATVVVALPAATTQALAAVPGLAAWSGIARDPGLVFSWQAGPLWTAAAAEDARELAAGSAAGGTRLVRAQIARGVWSYRVTRRAQDAAGVAWDLTARVDFSPEWVYDAIPALAAGTLAIGLLFFAAVWLIRGQLKRLSRGFTGLEETVKDVFNGETNPFFEAREFALTQHVANLFNQLVYFFRQDREARELAHQRDALTGLYTRAYLLDMLGKEIQRTKRYARPLSFVMCDIDHFKRCNDTYGHQMGDAVLARTAAVLQEHTRETDIVGRYGGEEIAIILSETPLKHAVLVAEKLRHLVEASRVSLGEQTIQITMSLGVTSFLGGEADTVEAIIARADKALYDAKTGGRNQVRRRI